MHRSIAQRSTLIVGLFLVGCGSSSGGDTAPGTDSGATSDSTPTSDSSTTDTTTSDSSTSDTTATDSTASDAPSDGDGAVACAPTANVRLQLNAFFGGTIPDTATATPSVCSTGPVTIGTTRHTFPVPVFTNLYFTADAGDTFWPAASVEWNRMAGTSGDEGLDVAGKTQVPLADYDATKAHVLVTLSATAAATTCDASGWVVSVPGHTEAKVQYTKSGGFTIDATLTSTVGSRGANAIIQTITPGAPVAIVATKTGCAANFVLTPVFTGNVPLVAGKVVRAVATVAVKP